MEILAKNIRHFRKKMGVSQRAFAEKLQTTRSSVGNYESGFSRPDHHTLVKISKLFNVPTELIITEDLSKNREELLKNYLDSFAPIENLHEEVNSKPKDKLLIAGMKTEILALKKEIRALEEKYENMNQRIKMLLLLLDVDKELNKLNIEQPVIEDVTGLNI